MNELDSLFDQVNAFERPAVENWHPGKSVDLDIRIAATGEWFHEGRVIPRHKLVKLFSTVIALRDGQYYLVTPPVKYRIQVDDLPFMAVELTTRGAGSQQLVYFRTNVDEVVCAGTDHPLRVRTDPDSGQPLPSIHIRDGLEARLTRPVFYALADICTEVENDPPELGVYSDGEFFKLQ